MTRKHLFLISLVALLGCFAGCVRFPAVDLWNPVGTAESKATKPNPATPLQVKVDGPAKPLSEGHIAATKADDLLPAVKRMLSEQRANSARALVQGQPDVALEVLRMHVGEAENISLLNAVAAAYDEQMGLPAGDNWQSIFTTGAAANEKLHAYGLARIKIQEAWRASAPADRPAAELARAAAATGHTMILLDQMYLCGVAALLDDKPGVAVQILSDASERASAIDRYQESLLALALSDALRRSGDPNRAIQVWLKAVQVGAALAQRAPSAFDPVFWDRASYLRPIETSWPVEALTALAPRMQISGLLSPQQSPDGEKEAIVWAAIGRGLMDRADHQAALLAFKRAETATGQEDTRNWLRLSQAEALACLDQVPAATAILLSLTASDDPRLARCSTATLGGLRLRHGDAAAGYRLLVKALEAPGGYDWPNRADAEADLGLAYLMYNEEVKGLKWLRSAQSRFALEGKVFRLSQSLWNEAAYWKQKKRHADEVQTQARLASHESIPTAVPLKR